MIDPAGLLDPYAILPGPYRQLCESQDAAIRNDHRAAVPDRYADRGLNGAAKPAASQ